MSASGSPSAISFARSISALITPPKSSARLVSQSQTSRMIAAAFSAYLANFQSFNVTYGSFAAAIILLVWLWLTNLALLFGGVINAEIERAKEIAEGLPEADTLNLPPAH